MGFEYKSNAKFCAFAQDASDRSERQYKSNFIIVYQLNYVLIIASPGKMAKLTVI